MLLMLKEEINIYFAKKKLKRVWRCPLNTDKFVLVTQDSLFKMNRQADVQLFELIKNNQIAAKTGTAGAQQTNGNLKQKSLITTFT